MEIVTVNGCFDILHPGHLDFLKFAKEHGDKLIVLLNSDSSIKKLKGKNRPIFSQSYRKKMLLALKYVDKVIIFNETSPNKILETVRPQIHVKSKDAIKSKVKEEAKIVNKYGGKVIWYKTTNNFSSTKIIEMIK